MASLPYVIPALKKHTATVIMAHGLGDSGAGWKMMLAENWRRRGLFDEVSFIFPNAPAIPITVNFGMVMPGWFDIAQLGATISQEDFLRKQDEPGILKSRDYFNSLIKAEMDKGIASSRIVIGGFSQGGAMALITGMTHTEKLGGIFGLSSFMPLSHKIIDLLPDGWPNKQTPVFMGHGDADPLVKYEFGRKSAEQMREMGMSVQFITYPGLDHSADIQEIQDLQKYLERTIPPEAQASSGL